MEKFIVEEVTTSFDIANPSYRFEVELGFFSFWILATGFWNDSGLWVDSEVWQDG